MTSPQMENSSRSYTAHVGADSITQVQGAVPSVTAFVANSGGFAGAAFGQQNISFTLPSGQSPSIFLDTSATSLSFTLKWVNTTASSVTNGAMNLIGSASSFIDSLQVISNNSPLEIIQNYGQLSHMAITSLVNASDRNGSMSFMG